MNVVMSTSFARALNAWAHATLNVLDAAHDLRAGDISNEVRATEITRPIGVVQDRLVFVVEPLGEAETYSAVLGMRALGALLERVALQINEAKEQ